MKIKEFVEPVFRNVLIFVYDCSLEKFEELLVKKEISGTRGIVPGVSGTSIEVAVRDSTFEYYLWIEKRNDFYTLCHEIIHLVNHIFSRMGIPFTKENDETIAYYHEYWMRLLWHEMGKPQKRKKKK